MPSNLLRRRVLLCVPLLVAACLLSSSDVCAVQEGGSLSEAEFQRLANQAAAAPAKPEPNAGLNEQLSILNLIVKGGVLMIPLGILSLIVVAMTLDRFIALRREECFRRDCDVVSI